MTVEGPLPPEETLARLARSDYFVLPSVDEPFGMAAVEAMSVGKPVIVTQSCGSRTRCWNTQPARSGSSRRELQEAMERPVIDGPRRRMLGANGRRLVEDRFTIDRIVAQLVADYAESIDLVRGR